MYRYLYILLILSIFTSCSNSDETALKEKISKISLIEQDDKSDYNKVQLAQYKDIELTMNKEYVESLNELISNSYNSQIEQFRDNELGVISGYKYMFKYIFSSQEEWNDLQIQLEDRYFNTLSVEQKAMELSLNHIEKLKELRTKFCAYKSRVSMPKLQTLSLPNADVSISALKSHSGKNLIIEIGTNILDVLLSLFLAWIVINILGYAMKRLIGCLITVVSSIIIIIISIPCTNYNDRKLLESLHLQESNRQIDFELIHKELNNNTYKFYDTLK